ncbi:hypothetical protein [Streptomyces sp. NPDC018833]|uniref:hypothetical protein n=1 Tax=Streptomyces sp. NPDC018833 TaxID=3365053 RepID=UPI0037AB72D8
MPDALDERDERGRRHQQRRPCGSFLSRHRYLVTDIVGPGLPDILALAAFQNETLEPRRDLYQVIRDGAADAERAADQTKGLPFGGITNERIALLAEKVATHPALADRLADVLAARLAE